MFLTNLNRYRANKEYEIPDVRAEKYLILNCAVRIDNEPKKQDNEPSKYIK